MTPHASPDHVADLVTGRRWLALLGVFALLMTLVAPFASPAFADGHELIDPDGTDDPRSVEVQRFDGEGRADTAGITADHTFNGTAEHVLLARWDLFPDSLSGNYLAGVLDVPVLIMPSDQLRQSTMDWLDALGTTDITILGETEAISQDVEDALRDDHGYNVDRIGGENRHETAQFIATGETDGYDRDYGTHNGDATAIVTRADDFADALVMGGIGYDQNFPVLLTLQDELDEWTDEALDDLGIDHVLIAGGPAAVSLTVEAQINDKGITTERIEGDNRNETATEAADWAVDNLAWTRSHVSLARGDLFPDALTLGPHAGVEQKPILLAHSPSQLDSNVFTDRTEGWLREHACDILTMHISGGLAAINQDVEDEAVAAAEDCPEEAAAITLEQDQATNPVESTHTVTATVENQFGEGHEGAMVRFEVTGTHQETGSDITDVNGEATFSYFGDQTGTDTITACANEDESLPADCEDADFSASVTKTWEEPVLAFTLAQEEEVNLTQSTHTVTATLEDQFGQGADGVQVLYEVTGTHEATGTDLTDAEGEATFSYFGTTEGTDTITACANEPGATPPASCDETTDFSDELVKAWFDDGFVQNLDTGEYYTAIQEAVDDAGVSHTLQAWGEFEENVTLGVAELTLFTADDASITGELDSTFIFLVSADGVTLEGFSITSADDQEAVRISGDDATLLDNTLEGPGLDPTPAATQVGIGIAGGVVGTHVEGNDISGYFHAIRHEGAAATVAANDIAGNITGFNSFGGTTGGNTVDGNTFVGNSSGVVLATPDNVVEGNHFELNGAGVQFWNDVDVTGNQIDDNDFTENTAGIWINAWATPADADFGDTAARHNRFEDNVSWGVVNHNGAAGDVFDAVENWWGADSGPSGEGAGDGDAVSDGVDFEPWCVDAECAALSGA